MAEPTIQSNHVTDNRIDMNALQRLLDDCFRPDGSVSIAVYTQAYKELQRFFGLLGRVFGFVASDIESKIGILERYLNSDSGKHYETVRSMLTYESEKQLLRNTKAPSGSRTLLRLHWSLEFIVGFLERVDNLEDDAKTCPASQESYTKTLGTHHPWLIRKAALLAMHTLPTAKGLVEQTCVQSLAEVRLLLPRLVEFARAVYQATQKLYEEFHCLDLP
ncbi:glycolipid transfer protein domain containing [Chamberlinius hualienensis]